VKQIFINQRNVYYPNMKSLSCRPNCAACCIAPSITSPLPGMPNGKLAGVPCVQLDEELRCKVFGQPERPAFCAGLQPAAEMCGATRDEALAWLSRLEQATLPTI
jgi:hypothetical protein